MMLLVPFLFTVMISCGCRFIFETFINNDNNNNNNNKFRWDLRDQVQ